MLQELFHLVRNNLNLFPLFMTLSLRYNPTKFGVIKGTTNTPVLRPLIYRNLSNHKLEYDFCVKKTEEILRKNISKIDDKKVAIGLSGGTDSSLNALILSRNDKVNLNLFCIGFGDSCDEFKDARKIAKLCNVKYREIIIKDIVKDMPKRVWEFGSPKSNLWVYYNFRAVRNSGAHTTISGEGGDELFGGYLFRYRKYLKKIPQTPLERAKRYIFGRSRDSLPNFTNLFGEKFRKSGKLLYNTDKIISYFLPTFQNKLSFLSQIFLADYNYKLRFDFIMVDNIFAKKEKINIISPFLQPNIIHFASHIPNEYKVSKHTSKMILRDILKKIGVPKSIYEKPKQGWGMNPITVWKGGLDDRCERFLFDGTVVRDGWINKRWVKEAYSIIDKKKNSNPEFTYPYINKIWDILSFEIFYRQRILKESKNGKISGW